MYPYIPWPWHSTKPCYCNYFLSWNTLPKVWQGCEYRWCIIILQSLTVVYLFPPQPGNSFLRDHKWPFGPQSQWPLLGHGFPETADHLIAPFTYHSLHEAVCCLSSYLWLLGTFQLYFFFTVSLCSWQRSPFYLVSRTIFSIVISNNGSEPLPAM